MTLLSGIDTNNVILQEVSASAPGYVFVTPKNSYAIHQHIKDKFVKEKPIPVYTPKKNHNNLIAGITLGLGALIGLLALKKGANKLSSLITTTKKPPKTPKTPKEPKTPKISLFKRIKTRISNWFTTTTKATKKTNAPKSKKTKNSLLSRIKANILSWFKPSKAQPSTKNATDEIIATEKAVKSAQKESALDFVKGIEQKEAERISNHNEWEKVFNEQKPKTEIKEIIKPVSPEKETIVADTKIAKEKTSKKAVSSSTKKVATKSTTRKNQSQPKAKLEKTIVKKASNKKKVKATKIKLTNKAPKVTKTATKWQPQETPLQLEYKPNVPNYALHGLTYTDVTFARPQIQAKPTFVKIDSRYNLSTGRSVKSEAKRIAKEDAIQKGLNQSSNQELALKRLETESAKDKAFAEECARIEASARARANSIDFIKKQVEQNQKAYQQAIRPQTKKAKIGMFELLKIKVTDTIERTKLGIKNLFN